MRHAALLLLFAALAPAADPEAIDRLVSRYHSFGTFNGAVLVSDGGEVVFKKGYGLANREWNIPNEPDTRFRLGSITKQFTATLILKLVNEGKVSLEAPLSRYVPEYPPRVADRVTVHQLLTHTSGIKSYTGVEGFREEISRDPYKPVDFLEYFADRPVDFEPGERFLYNNSGYFLLGVIIEKVTGKPYADVLRERIFEPLGMNSSGYDTHAEVIEKRATGYDYRLEGYRNSAYLDMSLPYAAGSLYSTVEDLYLWDRALADGKVLAAQLRQKMFTRYEKGARYGYGWTIGAMDKPGEQGAKLELVGHGGGINGFNTIIQRIPQDDHLVVILNNTPSANLGEMSRKIFAILYGQSPAPPKTPLSLELYGAYREGGLERATARVREIKQSGGKEFEASPRELVRFAGYLSRIGESEDEIAFLKLATSQGKPSAPALARLGDALRKAGKKPEAIKAYGRALEADPRSAPLVQKRLEELATEAP